MEKEKVLVEKVNAYRGFNLGEEEVTLSFLKDGKRVMGLALDVGRENQMITIIKEIFEIERLKQLEGREVTLVRKENDRGRVLGIGLDGNAYLYKRGNSKSKKVSEEEIGRLVDSNEEPENDRDFI